MKTIKNIQNLSADGSREMMRIGISTDFGWFELKRKLMAALKVVGYELTDIGDYELVAGENYPDFIFPLANPVSDGIDIHKRTTGLNKIKVCSEVNKIPGVCAAIITKPSDPTGEIGDKDLYVMCLGGQVKGYALSRKKVMTFLNADCPTSFSSNQRLAKLRLLGIKGKLQFA